MDGEWWMMKWRRERSKGFQEWLMDILHAAFFVCCYRTVKSHNVESPERRK